MKIYITRDGCNDSYTISRDKPKWDDDHEVFDCNKCVFLAQDEMELILGKMRPLGHGEIVCVSVTVKKVSKVACARKPGTYDQP